MCLADLLCLLCSNPRAVHKPSPARIALSRKISIGDPLQHRLARVKPQRTVGLPNAAEPGMSSPRARAHRPSHGYRRADRDKYRHIAAIVPASGRALGARIRAFSGRGESSLVGSAQVRRKYLHTILACSLQFPVRNTPTINHAISIASLLKSLASAISPALLQTENLLLPSAASAHAKPHLVQRPRRVLLRH